MKPFSIRRQGGLEWLVNPAGRRFFSVGVCRVDQGTAREQYKPDNPGYAAWQHYPDSNQWAESTLNRLKSWGFTPIGGWSDFAALRQDRADGENYSFGLVDIHNQSYEALVDAAATLDCTALKSRRYAPRPDASQGVPPAPGDPLGKFGPTLALKEWDRERGYVKPISDFPLADLYICWSPETFCIATMALPASLFGRTRFQPGDRVEFASTFHTHCRAYLVKWRGAFTLREARPRDIPQMLLARGVFVCECFFCMANMTKEATISVRLTTLEKGNLDADARMKGIPAGTAAAAYISEGVRRSQFPAVEFRNGSPGRVAFLVGSRWPVWMIVELVKELSGDIEGASVEIRKPAALVKMALAYADAYPEEINDCLELHAHRDFAGMKKILPGLELL